MSENFKHLLRDTNVAEGKPSARREAAVAAALTLINSKAANSPDKTETLKRELDNLSEYADKIQEALKVK